MIFLQFLRDVLHSIFLTILFAMFIAAGCVVFNFSNDFNYTLALVGKFILGFLLTMDVIVAVTKYCVSKENTW